MDRLREQQRNAIGKMSDERLRAKLVQAGYQEEVVGQLDRQTMMLTLAGGSRGAYSSRCRSTGASRR